MMPKEIFLSHSSRNRHTANSLAEILRGHNLRVWYSDTNIRNAEQWHDAIGRALKRCDWFIVLVSEDSINSRWVKMELMYALRRIQYKDHILPILIQECDFEQLSWTLDGFQMIDCSDGGDINYESVLGTWGIAFDPENIF
jgi:hypothetical protein